MRRIAPAFALYFLAPLVAEFFLGDFPLTMLAAILPLSLMYGGGALLIREVTRRQRRGWPTMLLLALAFGVLEEGLLTQSLFNPDYVHAHLLDQGFIPALGIAVPWTIFVLTIHTIWSISTPIAIVEESTRSRREQPWTRTFGLVVSAVLFLLGSAFTFVVSYADGHFMATPAQLGISGAAVVAIVATAFALPRRAVPAPAPAAGAVPNPWLLFAGTLAAGVILSALKAFLPVWPQVATWLAALVIILVTVHRWTVRAGWGRWHRFALACGAVLTYSWRAFFSTPIGGSTPTLNLVTHIVFAAVALAVIGYAMLRVRHQDPVPAAEPQVLLNV